MKASKASPLILRRTFSLAIVVLLGFAFLVLIIPGVPPVYATTPVVLQNCSAVNAGSVTTINCSLGTSGAGDLIIVAISVPAATAFNTPTDTLSTSYTKTCLVSGAGSCVAYGVTTSAGANSVTWTWTTAGTVALSVFELTAATSSGNAICIQTGSGSGTTSSTSSTCPGASTDFILSAAATSAGGPSIVLSPGTGFARVSAAQNRNGNEACGGGWGSQPNCSGIASPTSFPETLSVSGTWSTVGIDVGSAAGNGFCYNGATECYEQGPTCLQTSGTSMVTGSGSCTTAWSGVQWPTSAVANPFTELVKVTCTPATNGFYPVSVSSANFGALTSQPLGPSQSAMQYVWSNTLSGIASISISYWFVAVPAGTVLASDTITATFSSDISGTISGCYMITGLVVGTAGSSFVPYEIEALQGQSFTGTAAVNDQGVLASITTPALLVGDIITIAQTSAPTASFGTAFVGSDQCTTTGTCGSGTASYTNAVAVGPPVFTQSVGESYSSGGITQGSHYYLASIFNGNQNWDTLMTKIVLVSQGVTASGTVVQQIGATGSGFTGGCSFKNTATFTPANNTLYAYEANMLGNAVFNSITVSVSSVDSGVSAQTLQMLIYISQGATVSVNTPLVLAWSRTFSIAAGSTNQIVTAQPALIVGTPVYSGNVVAIAFVATNHIKVNQSSTSGLVTYSGSASTAAQPSSLNTGGTTSTSKVYLCASVSYQGVLNSIQVTTTTSVTTSTVTSGSGGNPIVVTGLGNLLLGVIVILGPTLAIGGLTRELWGVILGAVLGMGIGIYANIVPFYFVAIVALTLLAALLLGRNNQGGGGV